MDSDGDKLKVISASHNTKKGGIVIINSNGTATLSPPTNFVGVDSFTYTISDENGKTDKAKVTAFIDGPRISDKNSDKIGSKADVIDKQREPLVGRQDGKQQEDKLLLTNRADNDNLPDDIKTQSYQNRSLANNTERPNNR